MKRLSLLIIAILVFGSLVAGCGQEKQVTNQETKSSQNTTTSSDSKTENQLKGKITWASSRTDLNGTVLKDLVKSFMDKYPGTEVSIEDEQDQNALKTRMAAGEAPDMMVVVLGMKRDDYPKFYLPIDDLGFSKDDMYFYNSCTGTDGKLYAVPAGMSYNGIVYNKNVFKDVGIEKPPVTVDEFLADCEKIKAKGIVPIASNTKDAWPLQWWIYFQTRSVTGNVNCFNELANKNEFISGDLLKSFEFMKELKDKGYFEKDLMTTNWEGMKKEMATGKIAMAYLGTWFPSQVVQNGAKEEDIGMFPMPGIKGVLAGPDVTYALSKDSKAPDVAKAFLKYAWTEGDYFKKAGTLSPFKSAEPNMAAATELLSYNAPVLEVAPESDDYTAVCNKAQISTALFDITQEYLVSKNPDEVIKKYNEKWVEAKKALGK